MSITGEHAGKLHQLRRPTFAELYLAKARHRLARRLRPRGSSAPTSFAGLTVAIVALPLSMAIAIASGVTPDRGLYTAVVGGFLVSLLGGSRFQIGGPAGAFIVLVAADRRAPRRRRRDPRHPDGRHVPDRRGLAAARHLHQVHSLSGDGRLHRRHRRHHLRQPAQGSPRHHAGREGAGRIRAETRRRWRAACTPSISPPSRSRSSASPIIVGLRRWRPHWPGILIAVVLAAVATGRAVAAGRNHRHAGSAASRANCRRRRCRRSRLRRRRPCCPMRSPSRCSAPSSRCCRRWSPTA